MRNATTLDASAHRNAARQTAQPGTPALLNRLFALAIGTAGLFLLLALATYRRSDVPLLSSASGRTPDSIRNVSGAIGAWLGFLFREGIGYAAFFIPVACLLAALQCWHSASSRASWTSRVIAFFALVAGSATLMALAVADPAMQVQTGGLLGYLFAQSGRYYLGAIGTGLTAASVIVVSVVLVADQLAVLQTSTARIAGWWAARRAARAAQATAAPRTIEAVRERAARGVEISARGESSRAAADAEFDESTSTAPSSPRLRSTVAPKLKTIPTPTPKPRQATGGFQLPPLDLLLTPPPPAERKLEDNLHVNARILVETLKEFGIEAACVNIDRGPSVTRYELAPAPGVKITKIVSLADDLALVMKASSCHVVAPIPGKGLVGVEVPNSSATMVYLKEIITSREFQSLSSPLALGIGKDVAGQTVVANLQDCPHLLVAGATGSGKTVFLNSLLTGILCHASPDEVKFLMIDPKMVELVLFNNVPHLVAPVVTDAKKAAAALTWAVQEMEHRYQMLAELGARNIATYNQKVKAAPPEEGRQHLPFLVVVIDELADLMMVSSREVEESICRLAQMSRAVGIHVILATQRPSVDVITGVIKANFPARIAFQVASKVDSRTILDVNGADKLLGRGDLLFLRPGTAKPIRAQGAYLTDNEIEQVVSFVKAQRAPTFDERLMAQPERSSDPTAMSGDKDEMYEVARRLVIETGQASTSLLQRRLRLGYGRAARILDLMEQEGIVGPPQGSRPREVLAGQHAGDNRG